MVKSSIVKAKAVKKTLQEVKVTAKASVKPISKQEKFNKKAHKIYSKRLSGMTQTSKMRNVIDLPAIDMSLPESEIIPQVMK